MLIVTLKRPPRWVGKLCLGLAGLVCVAVAYMLVMDRFVSSVPVFSPIYSFETAAKEIALTFDVSWGHTTPAAVLDIMKKHGVKATFFVSAPWARAYPDLAKRIVAEGHTLANHGYRHINLAKISDQEVRNEIMKAHALIKEATGAEPTLFRPPDGQFDQRVVRIAKELQYELVVWSLDSLDWRNPPDAIVNRVLKKAQSGDIVLFHASDTYKETPAALPTIIESLRQAGFTFVTLGKTVSR